MQESSASLQTSFQYEGWRGIKREEGRGQERGTQKRRAVHFRNLEELGLKALESLGGCKKRGLKKILNGSWLHNYKDERESKIS